MFKWKSRSLYVRYLNCIIKGCCILYERFPVSVLVAAELNQSVGGNCKRWWSWSGLWMTENSFFSDHFLNVSSLQPVTEPTAHTTTTTTGWLKISIIFYQEGLSVHIGHCCLVYSLCVGFRGLWLIWTSRYLYSSTISTPSHSFLLMFRSRLFLQDHATKSFTSALYSSFCPWLIHPITPVTCGGQQFSSSDNVGFYFNASIICCLIREL